MSHFNILGGGATSYQEQHRPHSYYLKLYLTKSKNSPTDSRNSVQQLPKVFTEWSKNNNKRILKAKNIPYFIKDNFKINGGKLTPLWVQRKQDILKQAAQRHAQRTEKQIKTIQKAWLKRNRKQATAAAKAALIGKTAKHPTIKGDVIFTMTGIKEAINQPHKYFIEKNKAVVNVIELIEKGEYIKCVLDTKHTRDICHYIKIAINGEPAYIVIKQRGKQYSFYTIVDKLKI